MKKCFEAFNRSLLPVIFFPAIAIISIILATSNEAENQPVLITMLIGSLISPVFIVFAISILEVYRHEKKLINTISFKSGSIIPVIMIFYFGINPDKIRAQVYKEANILNLQEAIVLAKENYPSLKKGEAFIDREKARKGTSFDLGNTQVYTGKDETTNGTPGVQTTFAFQQANVDLLSGFSKSKLYKERIALGETYYARNEQELVRDVMQAYDLIRYGQAQENLVKELDSIYSAFKEAARRRYESGEARKLEYLAASSELQRNEVVTQQATDDIDIAKEVLKQFLGSYEDFDVPYKSYQRLEFLRNNIDSLPLENPDLSYARQNISVNEALVGVEKAAFLPKFNVIYGKQRVDGEAGFTTYQAGISLPLWFLPQRARVQAAQADTRLAKSDYHLQKVKLNSMLQQDLKRLRKMEETLNYYDQKALGLSREQIAAAQLASQEGDIDYVNYITILDRAIEIQQMYLQQLHNYNQQVIELRYKLGELYH